MKKYLVFIISLALLYTLYQLASGIILTALYTPDVYLTRSQVVVFKHASYMPMLVIFLTASIAYFFSQKISGTPKVQSN